MKQNAKKPIRLKNRTKFFIPDKDKAFVRFASNESYTSRKMKIEGYETRLYWQFKYCESVNGQTFFYTLTYADKNLPNKYGQNCFDYEDLRDLLTGGFRKQLLRKYGTTFKYFIGAELGDGKGKRGLENNPHYHVLFFLEPDKNEKFPYVKIKEEDFQHLIRKYWQGFDQDTDGWKDYKTECKYGIVKEGKYGATVVDFRACMYCAKYVCKDIRLKAKEINIRALLSQRLHTSLQKNLDFHKDFFHEIIYPLYNIPNDTKGNWKYNDKQMMYELQPEVLKKYLTEDEITSEETFITDIKRLCYKHKLWPKYNNFLNERIEELVETAITEWRNRYCNKCRISQGVGDYAMKFIKDPMNPTFSVPNKNGFKERPMSLYYYRKLFTKVIYPTFQDFKGNYHICNPIRVLNEDGVCYKIQRLDEKIKKMSEEAKNSIEFLIERPDIFEEMKTSDVNTEVWISYKRLIEKIKELSKDNIDVYERYAQYKLVYEDRYFKIKEKGYTNDTNFPVISIYDDYSRFLFPSAYSINRSDLLLDAFLDSNNKGYLSYSDHPYFLRYMCIFNVLDLYTDYLFIQEDNRKEKEAKRISDIRKFHINREMNEYFTNLNT